MENHEHDNVGRDLEDVSQPQPEEAGQELGHPVENADLDQEWAKWRTDDQAAEGYANLTGLEVGQAGVDALSIDKMQPYESCESAKGVYEHWKQGSEYRDDMLESRKAAEDVREGWEGDLKQTNTDIEKTISEIQETVGELGTAMGDHGETQLSEEKLKNIYGEAYEQRKETLETRPSVEDLQFHMDELSDRLRSLEERKALLEKALDQSRS